MSRIVVYLDGGLIQDVYLEGVGEPESLITLDSDLEGAEEEDIIRDPEARRGGFYVREYGFYTLPKECQFATILKKWDSQ